MQEGSGSGHFLIPCQALMHGQLERKRVCHVGVDVLLQPQEPLATLKTEGNQMDMRLILSYKPLLFNIKDIDIN